MWPIEFIKKIIRRMLRGELSLPEMFVNPARKNNIPTSDFSDFQGTSTLAKGTHPAQLSRTTIPSTRSRARRTKLLVGLPPSSQNSRANVVREQITIEMTAGELVDRLAAKHRVNKANVKLYEYKSRHSINLPSDFVRDSAFPFKVGDELVAKIEDGKVVIEKKVGN